MRTSNRPRFTAPSSETYVRWGQVIGFAEVEFRTSGSSGESKQDAVKRQMDGLQAILTRELDDGNQPAGAATPEQLVEFGVLISHLERFADLSDVDVDLHHESILTMSREQAAGVLALLRAAVGMEGQTPRYSEWVAALGDGALLDDGSHPWQEGCEAG